MALVDKGNGKDLEFGHVDYYTGEGRPVTRSENDKERHVNPELTVAERARISRQDSNRRNQYTIYLLCEMNTRVIEFVHYNSFTEALSLSWAAAGNHGKRLFDITGA